MTTIFSLMLASFISAQIPAEAQATPVSEFVPRFAFEVLNSKRIGRSIIHLEDLIGPEAKTVAGMPASKTVLIFALGYDCDLCKGYWDTLNKAQAIASKKGGRVIGVLWSAESRKNEIIRAPKIEKHKAILAWDAYRLVRSRFGIHQLGNAIIVRSDGTVEGKFAVVQNQSDEMLAAFERALREGG
jgi:hypothetical protein